MVGGVADPRAERAGELVARAGATAYEGWEQRLDGEALDALYVCVPPHGHGAVEEAATDLGLPLFVEKPLATDLATAERLAARIEAARLLTSVGYHWRYLDTLETARGLLAETPARMVLAAWLDKAPGADWWARLDRSGGQTVEQATHLFDVARVLVGEVTGGSAVGSRSPDGPGGMLDVCTAALRFESGAVASRMRVVPNGVDVPEIPSGPAGHPVPRVGALGRLTAQKGFHVLAEAVRTLTDVGDVAVAVGEDAVVVPPGDAPALAAALAGLLTRRGAPCRTGPTGAATRGGRDGRRAHGRRTFTVLEQAWR
ncbi:Gfo/Idh/MocA family protein [Blastococcus capsensis]|uniref:Gfo/Idh/MocA family protein n=1 Tax=Blastococcus capsensis TaxID=1564163 RepID=UPI002541B1A0|nr:Gfo/Idh/MocA family oxidoreductase [Blastococcus capsensis]MDK3256863.1 Gfo/Idh/MocA family oxidoreductase [Blastococcus capsensis]